MLLRQTLYGLLAMVSLFLCPQLMCAQTDKAKLGIMVECPNSSQRNNRLIERHETRYQDDWTKYEPFSARRKSIFQPPLGYDDAKDFFQQDGGEIIFPLPNKLQAYMLANLSVSHQCSEIASLRCQRCGRFQSSLPRIHSCQPPWNHRRSFRG